MGLRAQAATDLATITADTDGFGWPITVIDPDGTSAALTGLSSDIGHTIEPDTGMVVSGRLASVALAISALTAAGLGIPRGIADSDSRPWRVTFEDSAGIEHTFKVAESRPDRALGVVVCLLEVYHS